MPLSRLNRHYTHKPPDLRNVVKSGRHEPISFHGGQHCQTSHGTNITCNFLPTTCRWAATSLCRVHIAKASSQPRWDNYPSAAIQREADKELAGPISTHTLGVVIQLEPSDVG